LIDGGRIPNEVAGVEQRGLLTLVESVRLLELEELVEVALGRGLLSSRESSLGPSVVAVDCLGHIDAAELLERVLHYACSKRPLPVL
jgi:hypothetical protein